MREDQHVTEQIKKKEKKRRHRSREGVFMGENKSKVILTPLNQNYNTVKINGDDDNSNKSFIKRFV